MNLNQIKFSLAVVINLLTATTFGYFCFLGKNFETLGNKRESITFAVIITLLLIGTSLGAKFLKQTKRNFKSRLIMEIVLIILFSLLMACFTYLSFTHYFTVSEKQTEIKAKLDSSIAQTENMYVKYEEYVENRETNYKADLQSAVLLMESRVSDKDFKKYAFDLNGIPYPKQIKKKMRTIHLDLLPDFENIKTMNTTWLSNSKNVVDNWKPIGLVDVINNIEKYSSEWKNDLIEISKKKQVGEGLVDPFEYNLTTNEVKDYFTTKNNPTTLSLVYAILLYVLMILAWVFTKRDSRNPGFKILFGIGRNTENEL
jgi:hypothetical protein